MTMEKTLVPGIEAVGDTLRLNRRHSWIVEFIGVGQRSEVTIACRLEDSLNKIFNEGIVASSLHYVSNVDESVAANAIFTRASPKEQKRGFEQRLSKLYDYLKPLKPRHVDEKEVSEYSPSLYPHSSLLISHPRREHMEYPDTPENGKTSMKVIDELRKTLQIKRRV